eukprot:SAG31_NODE_2845_length_5009_cov_1.983299_3_plen_237_part_00
MRPTSSYPRAFEQRLKAALNGGSKQDGGNAFRPWRRHKEWLTEGGWYHVDQNARLPGQQGRVCVQGLVSLTVADEETGGLVVLPKSHVQHDSLCDRHPQAGQLGNFVPLTDDDPLLHQCQAKLLCLEPGDLALWDSRTVHCNTPSLVALGAHNAATTTRGSEVQDAQTPSAMDSLIRQVSYVCMSPAAGATPDMLSARQYAFVNNLGTNHYPVRVTIEDAQQTIRCKAGLVQSTAC